MSRTGEQIIFILEPPIRQTGDQPRSSRISDGSQVPPFDHSGENVLIRRNRRGRRRHPKRSGAHARLYIKNIIIVTENYILTRQFNSEQSLTNLSGAHSAASQRLLS